MSSQVCRAVVFTCSILFMYMMSNYLSMDTLPMKKKWTTRTQPLLVFSAAWLLLVSGLMATFGYHVIPCQMKEVMQQKNVIFFRCTPCETTNPNPQNPQPRGIPFTTASSRSLVFCQANRFGKHCDAMPLNWEEASRPGQGQVGEVKRCSKRTNPGKLTKVPWKSLLGSDAFPIETCPWLFRGRPLVFVTVYLLLYFSYLLRVNSPRILVCIRKSWIAASPFTSKKWCEMISGEQ